MIESDTTAFAMPAEVCKAPEGGPSHVDYGSCTLVMLLPPPGLDHDLLSAVYPLLSDLR